MDIGMRLGGFEPPTRGLEGRRSSAELQAPTRSVAPRAGRLLPSNAEVEGDHRRRVALVLAGRRLDVDGGHAGLAPLARQEAAPMAGARHPLVQSLRWIEAGAAVRQVLAHGPVLVASRRIELLDPVPERRLAGRLVV